MSSRMKKLIIFIPFVIFCTYKFWPEKSIDYPAGVLIPETPIQTKLTYPKEWQVGEYKIKALAQYDIKARILRYEFLFIGR